MTNATQVQSVNVRRNRFFTALVFTGLLGLLGSLGTLVWIIILPEQYFYDGEFIKSLLATELKPTTAFDTFANTALVFALMGFTHETPREITAISVFALAFIPITAWFLAGLRRLQYWNVLLLSAWIAVGSIYLGQLSKEVIALWFVSLILYAIGLKRPVAWSAFILPVLYGIGFRPYWLLVAFFWFLLWWLTYRKWTIGLKLIFFYSSMLIASTVYFLYRKQRLTEVRDRINEFRFDSEVAQSMIINFLPNSTALHDVANWTISWLFILFPIPVLPLLEPLQLIFFFLVTSTVISIYMFAVKVRAELGTFTPSQQRRIRACLTFMLAFTLVQAIFEPDYGSVLKHMTNLLPMLAYVLFLVPRGIKNAL